MRIDRLYTPRSGSKLFACGSGIGLAATDFASHVIACEAIVEAFAATPGAYWRTAGRELLEQLVPVIGGAAADERGTLIYYAPRRAAAVAAALLLSELARSAGDMASAEKLLWRAALLWGALIDPEHAHAVARMAAEQAVMQPLTQQQLEERTAAASAAAREWEQWRSHSHSEG